MKTNYSLFALGVSFYKGSSSFVGSTRSLFVSNSIFRNSFGSFFSSCLSVDFHLRCSVFKNILTSTIDVNNFVSRVSDTRIYEQSPTVEINHTQFIACSSNNAGGAFIINDENCDFKLMHCLFFQCYSRGIRDFNDRVGVSGGAFAFSGKSSEISFICVDKSISNGVGIAFYIQVLHEQMDNLNHSTICRTKTQNGKYCFCIEGGISTLVGVNSTSNDGKIASGGCFGFKPLAYSGFIRFCQFSKNGGISVFQFQVASMEDRGNKMCNFINNTLNSDYTGVLCISSELRIKRFYFFGNNATPVYTTSKMFLISCHTDWSTFGAKNPDGGCKVGVTSFKEAKLIFMQVC